MRSTGKLWFGYNTFIITFFIILTLNELNIIETTPYLCDIQKHIYHYIFTTQPNILLLALA